MSNIGQSQREIEAQKAAKRAVLRGQIGDLQNKINKAEAVIRKLNNSSTKLSFIISKWVTRLASFSGSYMTDIVVTDKFEGEVAEVIKTNMPKPIENMNIAKAGTDNVKGAIASQISKIQAYINNLESKKQNLMSALAAI